MVKRAESMTPDEKLARIRSLERKVDDLKHKLEWAQREEASVRGWAEGAWKEVTRLHTVCERHWAVMNVARVTSGLDALAPTIPLARWDEETRAWVPWPFSPEEETSAG